MPTKATQIVLAVRAVLHGPAGELEAIEEECRRALEDVAARHGLAVLANFVKPAVPVGATDGLAACSDRAIAAVSRAIGVPKPKLAEALRSRKAAALAEFVDEHKRKCGEGYRDIPVST